MEINGVQSVSGGTRRNNAADSTLWRRRRGMLSSLETFSVKRGQSSHTSGVHQADGAWDSVGD